MAERPVPGGLVLVQDLINTLDRESGEDHLTTPRGLAAFRRRHGPATLTAGDVPALQRLREALRAACRAHHARPAAPDTDADVNPGIDTNTHTGAAGGLAGGLTLPAPLTLRLSPSGAATLHPAPGLSAVEELTARVAAVVAAAEADGTWRRLKVCEADDCQWAYYDHSPAGRRRWCSMQLCGARAKMRDYRARRARTTRPARPTR